ncbi:MAG: hypothetical protein KF760_13220 [Candidatus Eremiobacteraeota bacterium]|nr:hypothetical protein [Candidatus Eremiobacteraeota bacterium]MCW5867027.1 hypothetical protein [Candidatus Eremiobacteraeota bacterium]
MQSSSLGRVWTAVLLSSLAFFTAACGGSDSNNYGGFSQAQVNQFLGNFAGRGVLSNGQTGTLNMLVAADGKVSGTFQVANPVVAALATFSVATGSYSISGSVDPNTGAFTVTGTVPDFGTFSITGVLPRNGGLGTYLVTLNGQTFSGSIQSGTTPPNNNSNPSGENTKPILGGTLSNFLFSGNGFNGVNPPLTSPSVTGELTTGSSDNNHLVIGLAQPGVALGDFRTLTFLVVTRGNPLTTGTYNILQNGTDSGFGVSLSDTSGNTVNAAWAETAETSGTFTITSLTDSQVEADFDVSLVGPNAETPGTAQGTFNTSGHIVANFLNLP